MHKEPTQQKLKELLSYNPETGEMHWLKAGKGRKTNKPAGCSSSHGHLRLTVDGVQYYLHRLAWVYNYGVSPSGHIDHINGVRHDNRLSNLRDVEPIVNVQNIRSAHKGSKTGILGVTKNTSRKTACFVACISVKGKSIHLGRFGTEDKAYEAYVSAKRKLHEGCTI